MREAIRALNKLADSLNQHSASQEHLAKALEAYNGLHARTGTYVILLGLVIGIVAIVAIASRSNHERQQ